MLLIHTEKDSRRIEYIFSLIFSDIFGIEYWVTNDKQVFAEYIGPKLSYGASPLKDELHIKSVGLLFETDVRKQDIHVFPTEDSKAFFKTGDTVLGFDIFAAAFYLLSRYEEYLPHQADKHGRFQAEDSIAYKEGFLAQPVVNKWIIRLKTFLSERFPELHFREQHFTFIPTVDIDQAFAFKHKSVPRVVYSLLKNIGNTDSLKYRWGVLMGREKDPFDQYLEFERLHHKYLLRPIFFFLLGRYNPRTDDININPSNPVFRKVIRSVAKVADIGIHPSYASHSDAYIIAEEKRKLEQITSMKVVKSRQHFLKMKLPLTYRSLIQCGIEEDYTMGYASQLGFRAGICSPFFFFDLEKNEPTSLKVFPFCVMDTTFKTYLKTNPEQSLELVSELLQEVKKVNGTFISLWHNESLSNYGRWEGWGDLYEQILNLKQ